MITLIHGLRMGVVIFFFILSTVYAQDTVLNKYGLWVINSTFILHKTIKTNPQKALLNIQQHIPGIVFDLKYASKNNFMGTPLYPPTKTSFLRLKALLALKNVQKELNKKGLGLKIFDAYRPYGVTEKMWEPVQDDRYAANPKYGSGHNRGVSVDLTIIQLKSKREWNMGTGFDNFSDTAHHSFTNLSPVIINNRQYLKTLMEQNGFKALETEWWHYYLPDSKEYELLDISFKDLLLYTRRNPLYNNPR